MNTVTVSASKTYNIYIAGGLISQAGKYISGIKANCSVCVISDSNVWAIYGSILTDSLQSAGFQVVSYVLPAGEESKNGENYLNILNFLAQNHITRSDLIIALGGGVVGDITGFTAATYLRGIAYVQIPTSLLAMVDSSVGGKTAIDLPAGKNLAGAFCQPSMVLCDTDALTTLPEKEFICGCAEVIKYGILFDKELFDHLEEKGTVFDREYVIARCVELKRDVVVADEFDTGERQLLNLGHTFGHSIEKNSNFAINHGQAVAIGTAIITKASNTYGYCEESTLASVLNILRKFGLPTEIDLSADVLYAGSLSDKKRTGSVIQLVVPKKIGECFLRPTKVTELIAFIKAGL